MTPVKQSLLHDPENGVWGDCHRAAVASLLDLPLIQVPHLCDGGPDADTFNERERQFFARHGLVPITMAFDADLEEVLRCTAITNPGVYFLMGGKSPRGTDHTVVGCDGEIIHDPHPDGGGLVGPMTDGHYWITYLGSAIAIKAGAHQ